MKNALASPSIVALLILLVAVATRLVSWWNPVAHVDDQFYLLVGESILKGSWPYLDIWDRKPPGLFLLYAGIAWVGGGTTLGLNIVATVFAAATAWVIRKIGLRITGPVGATLGGLAYLFVIPLLGGETGQSPVFYNLLVAGSAYLLVHSAQSDAPSHVQRSAILSMLLCGLAMTIKQTSLVEGAYFGLAYLWLLNRKGMSLPSLAARALWLIMVALLPTGLTLLGYALAGQAELDAYIAACFLSIFQKGSWALQDKIAGLLFLLFLAPLLLMAIAGAVLRRRDRSEIRDGLLIGWMCASVLAFAAFPYYFDHYALPVVVPLSVSASTLFNRPGGRLLFLGLAVACLLQPPSRDLRKSRLSQQEFARLVRAVDDARKGGCLFIGDGPAALYSATGACTVTPYLFPPHLSQVTEAPAVGADTSRELNRILAARPAAIVTQGRKPYRYSPAYRQFLGQMKRNYRRTYVGPLDAPAPVQRVIVWQRNDLTEPEG